MTNTCVTNFSELDVRFRDLPRRPRVAVVNPADDETRHVVTRCLNNGLAQFDLVVLDGDADTAEFVEDLRRRYPEAVSVAVAADLDDAARRGVACVRREGADVLFKGNINTDKLLRAVLNKEDGLLPPGHVISHVTAVEQPDYGKLLLFSDAAVIPQPTRDQFEAMVGYDVAVARKLGIDRPRVALIHFSEKVNPKFQNTLDYEYLIGRAADGAFGPMYIAGPMDAKTACDAHSAMVKGIVSDVCGQADILIFPDLQAGNTFYKTISLFGHARMAGMVTGTTAPVVVPSRADSTESKFYSLALACITAI